ncbi:E3 ubiquitin-protein ligase PUB22-like protein [Carex littledalei]|uniref:U-box domain-containing protein n=1 Tax=Carex littledalei TaxID=544730 RepID=A0A833VB70_9POAL|nr:E3 ubiquitin-protein ligase PUB22-like protein [Carex littledalei]
MEQQQVEIPTYFLCPISLELMQDPVALVTGITYDRSSIEKWIKTNKPHTCPVTRQPLIDLILTPNHTLRRLIQSWCAANTIHGYEPPPTPKPPVDPIHLARLLASAQKPATRVESLREIKNIVSESDTNRRNVVSTPGMVVFLASLVTEQNLLNDALSILCSLQLSEENIIEVIEKYSDIMDSLAVVLQKSDNHIRSHAVQFLRSIIEHVSPSRIVNVQQELFKELVNAVRDQVMTKCALHVLAGLCPYGRNRIKAVRTGAVPVLIEILLDEPERRICELALVVLDRLCGCAEGRAEVAGHAAGIAIVSRKIVRVSHLASERAVRILWLVARHVATPAVLHEMMQVGAVGKLCLVLQSEDCGAKAKEKSMEILKLHHNIWRNSSCLLPQFLSLYPSC